MSKENLHSDAEDQEMSGQDKSDEHSPFNIIKDEVSKSISSFHGDVDEKMTIFPGPDHMDDIATPDEVVYPYQENDDEKITIFPGPDHMDDIAMPDQTGDILAMRDYLDAKATEYGMRGWLSEAATAHKREAASTQRDDETILEVLHPSHELMKPFQARLKEHLMKRLSKLEVEKRAGVEALKRRKEEREAIGAQLYNVQQQLAKYQNVLDKYKSEQDELEVSRVELEGVVIRLRTAQIERAELAACEKRNAAGLQQEMENLAQRVKYFEQARDSMQADIAIVKRAAHKTEQEVASAEQAKKEQDLFVEKLIERISKLSDEVKMIEVHLAAQIQQTTQTKQAVQQATIEIESINMDKRNLFQQWSNSLIGVKKRDEAFNAMQHALLEEREKTITLEKELDGLKKSIWKEQEENEKLTSILKRIDIDINNTKEQISATQQVYEGLQADFSELMKILEQTEMALNQANQEKTILTNKFDEMRKELETATLAKQQLDDAVMQQLQQQLTQQKAAKYTTKLTDKIRADTKHLENEISRVENEISSSLLESTEIEARMASLEANLRQLNVEADEKNQMVAKNELEAKRRVVLIDRKQVQLENAMRKLESIIKDAGGEELAPLELQVRTLQRSINEECDAISELQDTWLKGQSELVKFSKEREQQSHASDELKKHLVVINQKKLRIEGEIEQQKNEMCELERRMSELHSDTTKLGRLIYNEQNTQDNLAKDNMLTENTFIAKLKEAERDSIEMEDKLEKLNDEKERLLNSLVEAERQIMLWEKKTELARETKSTIDTEVGQGEIQTMKVEIHRMQVRLAELKKQQSKMLADMDKTINKREVIIEKTEIANKKQPREKNNLTKEINAMKLKIKQTNQENSTLDIELERLIVKMDTFQQELKKKKVPTATLR